MIEPEISMNEERADGVGLSYPVMLTSTFFARRAVLVVGGGRVAGRRVKVLLEAGAKVRLIAPEVTPDLGALMAAFQGQIEWFARPWQAGDVRDFPAGLLVFAATNDPEVNAAVAAEARREGRLVNRADLPSACDFTLPGVVRAGEITVTVSTGLPTGPGVDGVEERGGASPALTAHLRRELSKTIGHEYGQLAVLLRELRPKVKRVVSPARRPELWKKLIESPALHLLKEGREAEARQLLDEYLREESKKDEKIY